MHKLLIALTGALTLAGCTMGPDYEPQERELPENWVHEVDSSHQTTDWQDWWTRFGDPNLNALVARAMDDNLELQLQLQRIAQARAELGLADAERWPSLNAQAEASREQQPEGVFPAALGGGEPRNQFSVSGVLNYEVDLWGRLSRQQESAAAQLSASMYGTAAVRLNLIADVVTTYFGLRATQEQLRVAEATIDSYQETLRLEELRYERGASNSLAVRRARAAYEGARAQLPDLRQQVETTRSALAMLVGYTPSELTDQLEFSGQSLTELRVPELVPGVLPSELLQRRPDVQAAEAYVAAATAQVGVARAQRWPSLNLTGLIGTAGLDTSDLFSSNSETWSITGGLAGPLFDFGRSSAGIDTAEALLGQAETEYEIAITGAFRDARDALMMYHNTAEQVAATERQVQAVLETAELAEVQYERGAIGLYELLDIRRQRLEAELAMAQATRQRLAASANLFKAMGGGWQHDPSTLPAISQ